MRRSVTLTYGSTGLGYIELSRESFRTRVPDADPFLDVAFRVEWEAVFRGAKDDVPLDTLVSLFERPIDTHHVTTPRA